MACVVVMGEAWNPDAASRSSAERQEPRRPRQGTVKRPGAGAATGVRWRSDGRRLPADHARGVRAAGRARRRARPVSGSPRRSGRSPCSWSLLAVAVPLLGPPAGAPLHLARSTWRVERGAYRVLRRRPRRRPALALLRAVGARLLAGRGARCSTASAGSSSTCRYSLGFAALPADGAWNTAVSFVTNTNWQWYSGEVDHRPPAADVGPHRAELRLRRRRHGGRGGASRAAWPAAQAARAGSATSGPTWCARCSGCCCRSRSSSALAARRPRRRAEPRRRSSPMTTLTGGEQTYTAARWPARRRSRSSAPTAAASSTPTPRTRSRTRRRCQTCSRSSCSCCCRSRWRGRSG